LLAVGLLTLLLVAVALVGLVVAIGVGGVVLEHRAQLRTLRVPAGRLLSRLLLLTVGLRRGLGALGRGGLRRCGLGRLLLGLFWHGSLCCRRHGSAALTLRWRGSGEARRSVLDPAGSQSRPGAARRHGFAWRIRPHGPAARARARPRPPAHRPRGAPRARRSRTAPA